jgi:hypothetical protein
MTDEDNAAKRGVACCSSEGEPDSDGFRKAVSSFFEKDSEAMRSAKSEETFEGSQ